MILKRRKTLYPKKKSPKKSRKALVDKLDSILSHITRNNANGICEVCGKAGSQVHHFFSKKVHSAVRWDEDNLISICFFCHIIKIHRQVDIEDAREALIHRIGEQRFSDLKTRAHEIKKVTLQDIEELIEKYK